MASGLPDLGKQIGPLPLGAWIVVVAGGLGIALYTRKAPTTPTVVTDTSTDPGVGTGPGWIAVPPPTTAPTSADTAPTSNEEWSRQAINYLIAQGYDPATSDSAIRKYIENRTPTVQEFALIRVALRHFGSPPIPLPAPTEPAPSIPTLPAPGGTPVTPVPPPVTTPPPPTQIPQLRYIVVTPWPSPHGSLYGIAKSVYGNGNRWPELFHVNQVGFRRPDGSMGWIVNPKLIYPGRTVYVP